VRRLGLSTFRVAMIFTALRLMESQHFTTLLICADTDFQTALEMVKILVQHAATVFDVLPAEQETPTNNNPRMHVSGVAAAILQANLHGACYG
jgi:hypothetical protein